MKLEVSIDKDQELIVLEFMRKHKLDDFNQAPYACSEFFDKIAEDYDHYGCLNSVCPTFIGKPAFLLAFDEGIVIVDFDFEIIAATPNDLYI